MNENFSAPLPERPLLGLLPTGGTIAGAGDTPAQTIDYQAGVWDATDLLAAVPGLTAMARFRSEAVAAIDSKDITEALWRKLAARTQSLLDDPAVTGVLITHGTDTLEETAYFLSLTLTGEKPVILTGAMRPATALSADGPANLWNAARLALSPKARGRGVLVTMNDEIFTAATVTKRASYRRNAFTAERGGPAGFITGETIRFFHPATPGALSFALPKAPLPPVVILYGYAGDDGALVRAALHTGAKGIVYAGPGMGSLPVPVEKELLAAQAKGVAVVRASRLTDGLVLSPGIPVPQNADAAASPKGEAAFIASGSLSPVKARILLQCALAQETPLAALPQIFCQVSSLS